MEELFQKRHDFPNYSVIVENHSLTYVLPSKEHGEVSHRISTHFDITIDKQEDGGKIQINYIDRWGSGMQFIHYAPTNLQSMFDFIAKGYEIKVS